MMYALKEGGIKVCYAPVWEQMNVEVDGYQPNPNGLYEVSQGHYLDPKFTRKIQDECAVKVLFDGLPALPARDYTVLFMRRDEAEIRASLQRVEEYKEQAGKKMVPHRYKPFDAYEPYNQESIEHVVGIAKQRRDMRLHEINYRDLVSHPKSVLERLNLPIDVDKAAATINPDYYRFRAEGAKAC